MGLVRQPRLAGFRVALLVPGIEPAATRRVLDAMEQVSEPVQAMQDWQEWTAVYVLNVVDGCIPSDLATGSADEIEEERRLLYVAMTRAKQHLALLVPDWARTVAIRVSGSELMRADAETDALPSA